MRRNDKNLKRDQGARAETVPRAQDLPEARAPSVLGPAAVPGQVSASSVPGVAAVPAQPVSGVGRSAEAQAETDALKRRLQELEAASRRAEDASSTTAAPTPTAPVAPPDQPPAKGASGDSIDDPMVGAAVQLIGLEKRPEFNGTVVLVIGVSNGHYSIRFGDGSVMRVRTNRVQAIGPSSRPPQQPSSAVLPSTQSGGPAEFIIHTAPEIDPASVPPMPGAAPAAPPKIGMSMSSAQFAPPPRSASPAAAVDECSRSDASDVSLSSVTIFDRPGLGRDDAPPQYNLLASMKEKKEKKEKKDKPEKPEKKKEKEASHEEEVPDAGEAEAANEAWQGHAPAADGAGEVEAVKEAEAADEMWHDDAAAVAGAEAEAAVETWHDDAAVVAGAAAEAVEAATRKLEVSGHLHVTLNWADEPTEEDWPEHGPAGGYDGGAEAVNGITALSSIGNAPAQSDSSEGEQVSAFSVPPESHHEDEPSALCGLGPAGAGSDDDEGASSSVDPASNASSISNNGDENPDSAAEEDS